MRKYELLFIARPTLSDHEVQTLIEQVKGHIANLGATLTTVHTLGRRQLAYEIDHLREGIYVLMQFDGNGMEIAELDRRLRVSDAVLRHLIVRIDEDLKRAERMKRRRQRKRSRRARTTSKAKGRAEAE